MTVRQFLTRQCTLMAHLGSERRLCDGGGFNGDIATVVDG